MKGRHRKPKTSKLTREHNARRSFSSLLVLVATLLGIATIGVAMHGMKVHVTIEP